MIISKEHKFIFIHIYKNAGISITTALRPLAASRWVRFATRIAEKFHLPFRGDPQPFPPHVKASELVERLGRRVFDSYYSFAFVRNPWDWQVSLYTYTLKNTSHHQHDLVKSIGNFEDYIKWRCEAAVRFQKDFIYSDDGELLIDFVGRYENLDSDFQTVCSRLGVRASLPELNVSKTKPYREFYTKETKEMVRRTFEPDIRLFGYDF